jgi:predicted amidohydrolase
MERWKLAAVQMDCAIGDVTGNLAAIRAHLRDAKGRGAHLVMFPECALTGYCFESKAEAAPFAEPIPGPSTQLLADDCRALDLWMVAGMLEASGDDLFNVAVLIGPNGVAARYRKIHLPFLGVDRFTTPGDEPFAVHDLGGLKLGMVICYDGSFPESFRSLMLQGADLIVLPTNWPDGALGAAKYLVPARAMENHVYHAAINRVGVERGFHFIGRSQIVNCFGETLAGSDGDQSVVLFADIEPAKARQKHLVKIAGAYELDRVQDRRPEMYGELVKPK